MVYFYNNIYNQAPESQKYETRPFNEINPKDTSKGERRQAEFITRTRLSPECSGCDAYKIQTYKDGILETILSLFSVDPKDPMVRKVLDKLPELEENIIARCNKARGLEDKSQEYIDFYTRDCYGKISWLLDTNHDGTKEIFQFMNVSSIFPFMDVSSMESFHENYICIMELSPEGEEIDHIFFPVEDATNCQNEFLGFLKTPDNHTHCLITVHCGGNSSGSPVLFIFDLEGMKITLIAKMFGFYEHSIPNRFRDLNHDGKTEIIGVGDMYWPIGGSHADELLLFDIYEFQEGSYRKANDRFRKEYKKLNKETWWERGKANLIVLMEWFWELWYR